MAINPAGIDTSIARNQAIERASERCPVIKRIDKVIAEVEEEEAKGREYRDVIYLLDMIEIRLKNMPEAAATRRVLKRIARQGFPSEK